MFPTKSHVSLDLCNKLTKRNLSNEFFHSFYLKLFVLTFFAENNGTTTCEQDQQKGELGSVDLGITVTASKSTNENAQNIKCTATLKDSK